MLPAWHIVGDLQIVAIRDYHLKQFLGRESKDELTRYVNISQPCRRDPPSRDGWNSWRSSFPSACNRGI